MGDFFGGILSGLASKNRRPDSGDPLVYNDRGLGGWNRPGEQSNYSDVVTVWLKQDPKAPRLV